MNRGVQQNLSFVKNLDDSTGVEAFHSHFWREGPLVCAQAMGECHGGQYDAHHFILCGSLPVKCTGMFFNVIQCYLMIFKWLTVLNAFV